MRINPYDPSRPANPQIFVGRRNLLRRLTGELPTGKCFELTGSAGIGKTSLLLAVQSEIRARQGKAMTSVPLPIHIECPHSNSSAEAILSDVVGRLAEALNEQRHLICPVDVLTKSQSEAGRGNLEVALKTLLDWAFSREKCDHLPILLLDDLHRLPDKALFGTFASILHTAVDQKRLAFVLSSREPLSGDLRNDVSPPLRMLISQHDRLGLLNRIETEALVRKAADLGWKVENECGALAYHLTKGHPYRLHYYLYGALSNQKQLTLAGLHKLHTPATEQHLDQVLSDRTAPRAHPKPLVFVSYSHKDEAEKEKLLCHLGVLGHAADLTDVWSDDRMGAGTDWQSEVQRAIETARVAVLLVTDHFLNSKFIKSKEVPAILQRRRSNGLTVYPIIARACAWETVSWLTAMNVKPKNGAPVWRQNGRHVDEELARIAQDIAVLIKPS